MEFLSMCALELSLASLTTCYTGDSSWIPPPVHLASYFPYLSEKERANSYYLQKLKDETNEMKRRFNGLVFDLQKDLEKTASLNDVVTLLNLHCDQKFEKLLEDSSELADVFRKMSKYISFFDYGPIKLLTSKLSSASFKKKLKKYKKKFQDYSKRRICECPSDAFEDFEGSEKGYVLKTEKDITTLTVEEVEKLQYEMNKILGHTFLHLLNVKKGCVEFIFRTFEENKFTVNDNQKQALNALGVISIGYGDELVMVQFSKEVIINEKIPGKRLTRKISMS